MLLYNIKNFTKKFYSRINRYRYFDNYIDENHTKYHHDSIIGIHKKINLKDKYILDIGGSNIKHELMKKLRAKRFVCIDNISKWMSYHESTANNMYMGKKIVSIDSNFNNIEDFSYIIDSCSENRIESFKNYFDLVVSFSTFEHVDSIIKTMNNIHYYLKDGGVCFVTYEPIYSCAVGHHYYIDHEKYNFK